MTLKGKTVIVTGGGRGVGKSIAMMLAGEGATLVICSRNRQELEDVKEAIIKNGGDCRSWVVDVTEKESVEGFVDEVFTQYGRVDVLINNAGWCHKEKPLEEVSDEDYHRNFRANVDSVFYLLRSVLPVMKMRGEGMIINISSLAGKHGRAGLSIYSATKFAVQGLTESVAGELSGTGISCVSVCPSSVNTRLRAEVFGEEDAKKRQSPDSVAGVVRDIVVGDLEVPNGGSVDVVGGKAAAVHDPLSS